VDDIDGDGDKDIIAGLNWYSQENPRTLSLTIEDASISEDGGKTRATVTRSDTSGDVIVNLTSSDTSEATVPASIPIADGLRTSEPFPITSVDDDLLDSTQEVIITASAAGYVSASGSLDVLDHETLTISIVAASSVENAGANATKATVTRSNTDTNVALGVTLTNGDDSEISIPASVQIPANESSASFDVDAVDDDEEDGTQTATITAIAIGYVDGTDTIEVTDHEDNDNDGIQDRVERSGPHDGDGNKDGMPDSDQNNCATFPNTKDGTYITLTASTGTALNGVKSLANPSPENAPNDVVFPAGFFEYAMTEVGNGASAVVEVLLHAGQSVNTYYAFGPTSDDPSDHWHPFMHNGETGAIIYSDRIKVHYVDGKRGDGDLTANGRIEDPAAPGVTNHPWQNPVSAEDVNNDGWIMPRDALVLINDLNAIGNRELPPAPVGSDQLPPYLDVSGDDIVSPRDVLIVINLLNDRYAQGSPSDPEASAGVDGGIAEGESRGTEATELAWLLQDRRDVSNDQAGSTWHTRSVVPVAAHRGGTESSRSFRTVQSALPDPDGGRPERDRVIRSDAWRSDLGLDELKLELTLAEIASEVTSHWVNLG